MARPVASVGSIGTHNESMTGQHVATSGAIIEHSGRLEGATRLVLPHHAGWRTAGTCDNFARLGTVHLADPSQVDALSIRRLAQNSQESEKIYATVLYLFKIILGEGPCGQQPERNHGPGSLLCGWAATRHDRT